MLVPCQEMQALGFPNSPRKLGLYEKPWDCISWYGPCTQLVNSNYRSSTIQFFHLISPESGDLLGFYCRASIVYNIMLLTLKCTIARLWQWKNIRGLWDSFFRKFKNVLENSPFYCNTCAIVMALYSQMI